jgi:hypothetical protein
MPPVSCRNTAEQRVQGNTYAAAVAQALTFRALFLPHFRDGIARRDRIIARALLRPRVHLQSTTRPIGRCRRHTRARVLLCRSGTHSEGGPTHFVSRARYLTMHCECAFPPTQPDLTRGVSGPTSPGGDEGGAFARGACRGGRWRPRVHTGVRMATEPPAARAPFWALFCFRSQF